MKWVAQKQAAFLQLQYAGKDQAFAEFNKTGHALFDDAVPGATVAEWTAAAAANWSPDVAESYSKHMQPSGPAAPRRRGTAVATPEETLAQRRRFDEASECPFAEFYDEVKTGMDEAPVVETLDHKANTSRPIKGKKTVELTLPNDDDTVYKTPIHPLLPRPGAVVSSVNTRNMEATPNRVE